MWRNEIAQREAKIKSLEEKKNLLEQRRDFHRKAYNSLQFNFKSNPNFLKSYVIRTPENSEGLLKNEFKKEVQLKYSK